MPLNLLTAEQLLFVANILADRMVFRQKYDAAIKRILIVKWDEIGDMAVATHVFQMLRESYPDASLTLLCKPFVKDLVDQDPHLTEIITDIAAFNQRYELVVELRGTWQTLFRSVFYKAKYRVSRAEVRAANRSHQLHEIETNTRILLPVLKPNAVVAKPALYHSANDEKIVSDFLIKTKVKKFALFHVGARRVLRQWPPERFAAIADFLHGHYGLDIIFAGTGDEVVQIGRVNDELQFDTFSFTDGYTLSQLTALCRKASFYIGNESGPLQIASVCNVPLVGIFGPGVPDVFYPAGENSNVVHHVLKCNPCNQIDCVEPLNPCINRVTIVEVLDAIHAIGERINLRI